MGGSYLGVPNIPRDTAFRIALFVTRHLRTSPGVGHACHSVDMSIDFQNVTLSEAYELTGVGTPPTGHGTDLDPDNPTCPKCQSQMRRCVDAGGNKVWPWHTERQIVFSQTLLSDPDWVANGPAAAVAEARSLVEAYELGRKQG